jgi:hypothetical protein
MMEAPQPANGHGSPQIPTCTCQGKGAQKRIARLVAEKYALRAERGQLQRDLERALAIIDKYRAAVRAGKIKNV